MKDLKLRQEADETEHVECAVRQTKTNDNALSRFEITRPLTP